MFLKYTQINAIEVIALYSNCKHKGSSFYVCAKLHIPDAIAARWQFRIRG